MALRKHDSVVVLEIIASFALLGTFAIALMLLFIHKDLSTMNSAEKSAPVVAEKSIEKITIQDLDPALLEEINNSFSSLSASQQQSQAQLGFYLGKVLEKQFSQEELKAIDEELKQAIEAAKIEAEKKAAANAQAPVDAPIAQ